MTDGYLVILRLFMFLFPEAETSSLPLIEKNMKASCLLWGPKERDNFHLHHQLWFKEVRKCRSELLFCHKHFIAPSPIIKMAKCSENENFSSGTNSYRFIILPRRDGIEPFLQPKVTFIFSIESISVQSCKVQKERSLC